MSDNDRGFMRFVLWCEARGPWAVRSWYVLSSPFVASVLVVVPIWFVVKRCASWIGRAASDAWDELQWIGGDYADHARLAGSLAKTYARSIWHGALPDRLPKEDAQA